jgi:ABC-type phosphate transport system auxiliary subunit
MYVETQEMPNFTPQKLESLRSGDRYRRQLLHQIVTVFETRYNCSLSELERKLENLEIDEHPAWEDSIEWRNGVEQLEHIQMTETIFIWLQNLLKQ